jgi:hypothetical protein
MPGVFPDYLARVAQRRRRTRTDHDALGYAASSALFLGAMFSEVDKRILYRFARIESIAAEIEEKFALH